MRRCIARMSTCSDGNSRLFSISALLRTGFPLFGWVPRISMTTNINPQQETRGRREASRHVLGGFVRVCGRGRDGSHKKGRIVRINTQAEKLFGYSQGDLRGQLVETLVP